MTIRTALALALACLAGPALAADYPAGKPGDWVARDFHFHDGSVMPELKLHYTTLGDPQNPAVLVIHGTAGTGAGLLSPGFAGELFGPGQVLDAQRHFIILPDTLGTGGSSKPSDGMRAGFPRYDYADMVLAEYRLVTEGLGLHHLRLVIGNSMGGMHVWDWAVTYPGFADALVPMASQPTAMASRNWMERKLLIDGIKADPGYDGGNYTAQPAALRMLNAMYAVASNGGGLHYQDMAPTHAKADAAVDSLLALPGPKDANDYIYQWDASRDYDPEPFLDRIADPVLAINSADDERNPPDTGVTVEAMKRVKGGRLLVIPASAETRGHGTTGMARFWAADLAAFLKQVPAKE